MVDEDDDDDEDDDGHYVAGCAGREARTIEIPDILHSATLLYIALCEIYMAQ